MTPFEVKCVGVVDESGGYSFSVGIAENSDGGGRSVIFGILTDALPDEGDDYIYSVTDEGHRTSTGGVVECFLNRDRLLLSFSEIAAQIFEVRESRISFPLQISDREFTELADGLARILDREPPRKHDLKLTR
ncbi:hypothetical protein F4553_001920 [Allocatelliglobosispora scoriae]|uniref:Immunity protein 10 n=1 Tax=Allocatelliglobosispora scoriae TaxID=643052 RepID=A0A841BNY6_9ACTN|nr:hypothetical protein [Allocatelliglobosispora scoriae]MBB5868541.1 hypothetical protein [Allocatelliglobosispora scoriae]